MKNNLPDVREKTRPDKSREFRIQDTAPEEFFDRSTKLAAKLLNVPVAMTSLLDKDSQWIKSAVGTSLKQIPRDISFCSHTISGDGVMVVENAAADERFASNPLVTGTNRIRAYAGAPLRCGEGLNLGTLSVIDNQPREFSLNDQELLQELADIIAGHMETRLLSNRAIRAEQRLIDAVDSLPDGLVFYDSDDRLVMCNQRYREIYAESADLIVPGARFEDIIRGGVERGQYPEAFGQEEEWIRERVRIHQNPGDPIEQQLPGDHWMRIQEGRTSEGGIIGFRFDITQLKRQERELTRMAWTDSLTGLLSRLRFLDLSGMEFDRARRHGNPLAMLVLDIDHFKQVNDRYGHAAGDAVLKEAARRWKSNLRNHDLIGRLGGEEFGVLLPETGVEGVTGVAEKLCNVTSQQVFEFEEYRIPVTVSIGIAVLGENANGVDEMMMVADKALYEVKRNGRNGLHLLAA